jgi:murein DD-endopeptidase MepM/ murein hydrolase activator NlpD
MHKMTKVLIWSVVVLILAAPLLIGLGGTAVVVLAFGGAQSCSAPMSPAGAQATIGVGSAAKQWLAQFAKGDADQRQQIAELIIQIGNEQHRSAYDISLAIATAIQESGLRNLDHGDRRSLGIYQQQWDQGWGTPAQILTPRYAISKFYAAMDGVPQRASMSLMDAALLIQRPDPYYYHRDWHWDQIATEMASGAGASQSSVSLAAQSKSVCDSPALTSGNSGVWQSPVKPGAYTLTDRFGMRINPVTGAYAMHHGVDFAAKEGTPIYAAVDGTLRVMTEATSGEGNTTWIDTNQGVNLKYMHQSGYPPGIHTGSVVHAGDLVGYVGHTGQATGPHLHFGVYDVAKKDFIEPEAFMKSKGITL